MTETLLENTTPSSDKETARKIKEDYQYGFHDDHVNIEKFDKGLNADIVRRISAIKEEPQWMTDIRLNAIDIFNSKPIPTWGGDMSGIDFNNIIYYVRPQDKQESDWDDVPDEIRNTYDKLGIPDAEKKYLAGVKAQYESEVIYGSLEDDLAKQGVIFLSTDEALKQYPELVREYFATIIPAGDNKFAALNTAVWSGGSFIYVPKGVNIEFPLQAYFRINSENMGQFERTLIICDEGSTPCT